MNLYRETQGSEPPCILEALSLLVLNLIPLVCSVQIQQKSLGLDQQSLYIRNRPSVNVVLDCSSLLRCSILTSISQADLCAVAAQWQQLHGMSRGHAQSTTKVHLPLEFCYGGRLLNSKRRTDLQSPLQLSLHPALLSTMKHSLLVSGPQCALEHHCVPQWITEWPRY